MKVNDAPIMAGQSIGEVEIELSGVVQIVTMDTTRQSSILAGS